MASERRRAIRCAIYTRKSSEEGLEQAFNSLDAQREACAAYIQSQRHEGWKPLPTQYDDGGYSGGSMERPALSQLLQDIDAGRVDAVVVYKVDRLTRSLADFAKIVEIFDAKGVSFVSVTQQFNTTTSMGRLTLNVLLSFAQFEREVTGERIRDKIAASKKKGMWMGGYVPLGYDLKERKLVVNPDEASLIGHLFTRYAELGSVKLLKAELDAEGVRSKLRVNAAGKHYGGAHFSRGALYALLQNRLYLGQTTHRGVAHPGEHEPIVSQALWDRVQSLLEANTVARRNGVAAKAPSLLAGLLYDERGNRLTPSHTAKDGKRYRYYVSQATSDNRVGRTRRLPAHEIEDLVSRRLSAFLGSEAELLEAFGQSSDDATNRKMLLTAAARRAAEWNDLAPAQTRAWLRSVIARVVVGETSVELLLRRSALRASLLGEKPLPSAEPSSSDKQDQDDLLSLTVEARLRRCTGELRLVLPSGSAHAVSQPNPALIKAIARGYRWYEQLASGKVNSLTAIAKEVGVSQRYVSRVVRASLLAPDLVEMILKGRQPPQLTVEHLFDRLPIDWNEQRRMFAALGR